MITIRERLRSGEAVFGPFWKTQDLAMLEVAASSGFDFALIDQEHAKHSFSETENMVRGCELAGMHSVVRVADNRASEIIKALDAGAQALMVPQVTTKAEALQVIDAAKYQPLGHRGMDMFCRAARYGFTPKTDYMIAANEYAAIIVQAEGLEALENLPEILTIPEIDCIFFGPYDLSQSMGVAGQIEHPEVKKAISELVMKVKAAGKSCGVYCDTPEQAKEWADLGIQFISIGVELTVFRQGCMDWVERIHN